MAATLHDEVVETVDEQSGMNATVADSAQCSKKDAAFAKFTQQLRRRPSNFCPGSRPAWVGTAGRRCRGKRSPPGMYKDAEPCVFSR
eukprot:15483374-Alexandrium_andersonii.AAC.1